MKIALLGAGHIGQTIARLLHASGDYQVSVLDKNAQYLKVLADEGLTTVRVDSDDPAVLGAALRFEPSRGGAHGLPWTLN